MAHHAMQGLVAYHAMQGHVADHAKQGLVADHAMQGLVADHAMQGHVADHANQGLMPGQAVQGLMPGHGHVVSVDDVSSPPSPDINVSSHAVSRSVACHVLLPGLAMSCPVLPPGLVVPGHALPPGLAMTGHTLPPGPAVHVPHDIPWLTVPVHVMPGLELPDHTHSEGESALILPSVSIMQNSSITEVAKITEQSRDMVFHKDRKDIQRTSQLLLLKWKVFQARQFQLSLSVVSMVQGGDSENQPSPSKCLNNNSRALNMKLRAATLLASVGLFISWSECCQFKKSEHC